MTISTWFFLLISTMDVVTGLTVHLFCSVYACGMGFGDWLVAIIAGWFCQFFFVGEGIGIAVAPLTGYSAAMNEILESIMTTQAFI
jgi:hypothetical protein